MKRAVKIGIRPARAGDAHEIARLIVANADFYEWQERVTATPETIHRDGFGKEPLFWVFLAEIDGVPVGFIQYFFIYHPWKGVRGLHVSDVYLDEAARGKGTGRRLMAAVAHRARLAGCVSIDLRVSKKNRAARQFYEGLGMKVTDDIFSCRLEGEPLAVLADAGEETCSGDREPDKKRPT